MYRRFLSFPVAAALKELCIKLGTGAKAEAEYQRRERKIISRVGYQYPTNGEREVTRRRSQIAAGSLKRDNGLAA